MSDLTALAPVLLSTGLLPGPVSPLAPFMSGETTLAIPGPTGADGVGIPTGGATGQVLAKASGDDYDAAWIDPPAGGSGIDMWTGGHASDPYTITTWPPNSGTTTLQPSDLMLILWPVPVWGEPVPFSYFQIGTQAAPVDTGWLIDVGRYTRDSAGFTLAEVLAVDATPGEWTATATPTELPAGVAWMAVLVKGTDAGTMTTSPYIPLVAADGKPSAIYFSEGDPWTGLPETLPVLRAGSMVGAFPLSVASALD